MRVFLSYSSHQRDLAATIAARLREDGVAVFFDRDELQTGKGFDREIRRQVHRAHLMVVLLSPAAVADRSYVRTEVKLARSRWRSLSDRVLPVIVEPTPLANIPPALKALTILEPEGDVVADIVSAVDQLARKRRCMLAGLGLGLVTPTIILAIGIAWLTSGLAFAPLSPQWLDVVETTVEQDPPEDDSTEHTNGTVLETVPPPDGSTSSTTSSTGGTERPKPKTGKPCPDLLQGALSNHVRSGAPRLIEIVVDVAKDGRLSAKAAVDDERGAAQPAIAKLESLDKGHVRALAPGKLPCFARVEWRP